VLILPLPMRASISGMWLSGLDGTGMAIAVPDDGLGDA